MSVKSLLLSWWRPAVPVRRGIRLLGEELESRCLLASYLWNPPGTDHDWETAGNWMTRNARGLWVRTQATPGADDDVNFFGESPAPGRPWDPVIIYYNTNKLC